MKMQVDVRGSGPELVLVPGGLTGWISWIPHAERLARTRKVIRVQLLNVQLGLENVPLPDDYSVRYESEALRKALDDIGLKGPVDFVAWSYGGMITLNFALDHPDRVRTLTLIEPPAIWALRERGPLDEATQKVISILGKPFEEVTEQDLEEFASSVGLLAPGQNGAALPQWPVWMAHRRSIRNNAFVVAHTDSALRLKAFRARVLLVKGTDSAPFLHSIIDALAGFLPHAVIVEMPAGHAPQIVSIDRFLATLLDFLEHR